MLSLCSACICFSWCTRSSERRGDDQWADPENDRTAGMLLACPALVGLDLRPDHAELAPPDPDKGDASGDLKSTVGSDARLLLSSLVMLLPLLVSVSLIVSSSAFAASAHPPLTLLPAETSPAPSPSSPTPNLSDRLPK